MSLAQENSNPGPAQQDKTLCNNQTKTSNKDPAIHSSAKTGAHAQMHAVPVSSRQPHEILMNQDSGAFADISSILDVM